MLQIILIGLLNGVAAQYGYGPGYGGGTTTTGSGGGTTTSTGTAEPEETGGGYYGDGSGTAVIANGPLLNPPRNLLIAHVVCGALATMFFIPMGVLIPRYARAFTTKRWWFFAHLASMGVLAFVFAVAAMGISRNRLRGTYNSVHSKLALTLLCLIVFQMLLGLFVHFVKTGAKTKIAGDRGPSNFLHVFVGLVTLAVGFATAYQGMTYWWPIVSGTGPVSKGYIAGWAIIVTFTAVAYLAGLLLVPRQERLANKSQTVRRGDQEAKPLQSDNGQAH